MTETRLRLTILGGFLGAGKTTWLRHHLHAGTYPDVHVIVNEAADAPVDDALLATPKMTLLAGACVCCTGQASLRTALRGICDDRSGTTEGRTQTIVLETSGLADPGAVVALIQSDPILIRQILVAETVVIVDAPGALAQLTTEPLCRRQIAAADRLILTKTEGVSPAALTQLRATLHLLAPTATQSGAAFGTGFALPDLAADATPLALPDAEDIPLTATRLDLGDTPDWTAFTVWLSALLYARGDRIVRVKGVIRTPAGRLLLQAVRTRVQSPEILPDAPSDSGAPTDNSIAVIGRGFTQEQLEASLKRYSA